MDSPKSSSQAGTPRPWTVQQRILTPAEAARLRRQLADIDAKLWQLRLAERDR